MHERFHGSHVREEMAPERVVLQANSLQVQSKMQEVRGRKRPAKATGQTTLEYIDNHEEAVAIVLASTRQQAATGTVAIAVARWRHWRQASTRTIAD